MNSAEEFLTDTMNDFIIPPEMPTSQYSPLIELISEKFKIIEIEILNLQLSRKAAFKDCISKMLTEILLLQDHLARESSSRKSTYSKFQRKISNTLQKQLTYIENTSKLREIQHNEIRQKISELPSLILPQLESIKSKQHEFSNRFLILIDHLCTQLELQLS